MADDAAPWSLTIPTDLRLLALARAFVEAVCQVAGMDDSHTHQVVLATDEATNNAIRHAHRYRPDAPVHIRCWIFPGRLEIHLLDHGDPFDLKSVPALDPGEVRPGGRGVFLMRKLMDEVTREPRPEGGNILCLVKKFAPRG